MKKALFLLTLLFSGFAFANKEIQANNPKQANPPMLKLAVYDVSSAEAKDIGLKYSRRNKNLQLCWSAFNLPLAIDHQHHIYQQFIAPNNKAKFQGEGLQVKISNNGKTSMVYRKLAATNNSAQQCWKFGTNDPLGKYKLTVRVNNIQFNQLEFEIVK